MPVKHKEEDCMMRYKDQKGFTLIEVIVVAGIIAILAGVLVPMIFNQIDESKKTRALADTKSIQSALIAFKKDVGVWPYRSGAFGSTADDVTMLVTGDPASMSTDDITQLKALGYNDGKIQNIKDHLNDSATATAIYGSKWKGPYLADIPKDPWGKVYIIPIGSLTPVDQQNAGLPGYTGPVWIFSAGAGGVYDTDKTSEGIGGQDDQGVRIQ
jgi:general secretion pathway protein G